MQTSAPGRNLATRLAELTKPVTELEEGLLASAVYDGDLRVAVLKFYDPKLGRFWLWRDNTGHRPYCYTRLPYDELAQIRSRKDVVEIIEEEKLDLLNDTTVKLRKIVTTDPLAIGGGNDSIRDSIRAWEADIKYYENYAYDKGLRMGTYYGISNGNVVQHKHEVPDRVAKSLEDVFRRNPKEFAPYLREWAELLGEPLVDFKRVALDIEVANEEGRMPDPERATLPVIAVSFFNDAEQLAFVLKRNGSEGRVEASTTVFDDEVDLLRAVFAKIMDYPMIVTFNGDDFDLRYLKHRADALKIGDDEDPIQLQRQEASIKHGIHIDLYRFFNNRSIQVYAFSNRYAEHTLNGISEALLGKSKIEFEGNIGDLPLAELVRYCMNDSRLTYELTTMGGSVVVKLLLVVARIGKMPMNDAARLGVSNWIRSMLFSEHRRMGALIPRQDELSEKGGASSQAIIKGKKYKGGLVIEPKPGVFFDVSVLDFASLVYDESILVRKRQTGQVYKTKIGEFVEQRLPSGEGFTAREIAPTWDVLSFDYEAQRTAWKTVTAVIRHPSQADVLEVFTESGRRVRITRGHSVISIDSAGKKKTVRGSDLKNGDYLVVLSSFHNEQHDTLLDLLPHLRQLGDYRITRGGRGHGRTVALKAKRSHRRFVLPRFLPLTSELMWGLGYWVAEGWIDGGKQGGSLRVEASSSDIERAQSNLETAGFKTWVSKSETAGCSNLGIGGWQGGSAHFLSGAMFARLVRQWFGDDADNKRIPDWVLRLPVEMRRAFVDGYYRGDGFNSTRHGQFMSNGRYKVGSYSKPLIEDLLSLGLTSGFHCLSKALGDPESYLTWSDGAQAYLKTKRPPPELLVRSDHVQSFAKTKFYASHRLQPARYERVNRTSVEAYKRPLRRFYNGDCHFEKIKRISAVKNKLPVYDISVRGSESFFTGEGVLVSNSLYPSLIKVHNLSYETVNCPHPECRSNKVPDTTSWVCTKRKGVTSLAVGSLRDLRVNHYKPLTKDTTLSPQDRELYHVVTQGLKVYLNAAYGTFGFETFAFYCLPVAEATAALGRDAITRTIQKCNELGINVLYSDSITGERCVALLDPVRTLRVMPVEKFFDSQGSFVTRVDGKDEAHPLGWKALSMNPETGRVQFKEILAVIRHRNTKRIYRVREKWGVTRVTEDHSLLAHSEEGLVFAKPTELSGKHVVRVEQLPKVERIEGIDVYEWLQHLEYRTMYKGRVKVLKASCDDNWVWFGWIKRKKYIRVRRHIKVGTPEFGSLVELLGAYVSEGSSSTPDTTRSRLGASIANSDLDWLGHLRECYLSLFDGAKASIIRSDQGERLLTYATSAGSAQTTYVDKTHKLQMMNEISAVFFKALGGQESQGKKVPEFIFHVPEEYKRLFLNCVVKGDGSRVFDNRYSDEYASKNFKFESSSLPLISGLSLLLTSLGQRHTMNYRAAKDTYTLTTSSEYNDRNTLRITEETYNGFVYDLSVADYHTFVDACGGVVLKNTDSLFLQNPSKEQVTTVTRWAEGELGVELDLDKTYRYIAFSSRKKNYFGVLPDGTADIKGLTGKKSQTPEYLKRTFYSALDILSSVQSADDFEKARTSIRELLTGMISSLKNRKVPVEDLAFNVMMGKPTEKYNDTTPQHVRAAKLLEEKGREIRAGDIIGYVKTKNPPYVKPVELAKVEEVDADKYIEYAHSMFDQMLDALDFSFDEIMGATTLDLFWS